MPSGPSESLLAGPIYEPVNRTKSPVQSPPTDRTRQIPPNDSPGSVAGIDGFLDTYLHRILDRFLGRFLDGCLDMFLGMFLDGFLDMFLGSSLDGFLDRFVGRFLDRILGRFLDRLLDRLLNRPDARGRRRWRCRSSLLLRSEWWSGCARAPSRHQRGMRPWRSCPRAAW